MNTPGTVAGNWHWRFNWQQLQPLQKDFFAGLIRDTRRSV
jgi:4-alpha-glucanotransferase